MALVEGAFVWAHFPTREAPREPGPPHICYCVAVSTRLAVVAYTSSQPWTGGRLPLGVRVFDGSEAANLSQRAFVLYLNRLATLPIVPRWFPRLDHVVAVAPPKLREELLMTLPQLPQRGRELVVNFGPET